MNAPVFPGWEAEAPGWIIPGVRSALLRGPGPCIVCPILQGLGAELADIAATLPVGDANGLLLDAVGTLVPLAPHVIASVLANDPFRQQARLLRTLREHDVRAVANWPSLGLISGELASALTYSGFTFDAEMTMLRRARAIGLSTVAFICAADQVAKAVAAQPDMIVVAPALCDATEQDRTVAAREAETLFASLKTNPRGMQVRLYETARLSKVAATTAYRDGELFRFAAEQA